MISGSHTALQFHGPGRSRRAGYLFTIGSLDVGMNTPYRNGRRNR